MKTETPKHDGRRNPNLGRPILPPPAPRPPDQPLGAAVLDAGEADQFVASSPLPDRRLEEPSDTSDTQERLDGDS